ncbi:MAG: 2-C-methyl-D-erythritol 4-phosphate cytidylyltransferase, partial [Clostridia bacterium]|nr:2-C-methyl-D-erythritol 4-phosphate cytidylyltransferase [Clostridia bacterium]
MSKLQQIVETVHKYLPDSATAAVILAAGDSKRMGNINKLFYQVGGIPVLAHTLIAYQKAPLIREIVVVAKPEDFGKIQELKRKYGISKLTQLANGGETRQESAKNGIEKLGNDVKYVAIADGARCLTTPTQITKVCLSAYRQMAACAAHKVTDTVKRATVLHNTTETIDRSDLWEMQTPQVFNTALYQAAMIRAEENKLAATDDATLIEGLG